MEIKQTDDYSKFEMVRGNRTIVPNKVNRIINDVKNGLNLFPYCPIVVNDTDGGLLIIDGHHRFTACVELKYPVYYVIAENITLRDIARMNMNTDKWTNKDFLEAYIKLGIADYQKLKDFIKKYTVSYSLGISLLMYGKVRHNGRNLNPFRDGNFKAAHLEDATAFIKTCDSLFDKYVFYRHTALLESVERLNKIGLWDVEVMKKKISDHPNLMEKQSSVKLYMYLLDRIYNTRNRDRRRIF